MGKGILILIMGSIAIFGIVNFRVHQSLGRAGDKIVEYYSDEKARSIANSVAEWCLMKLADNPGFRQQTPMQFPSLYGGSAVYTVKTVEGNDKKIRINVYSEYNDIKRKVYIDAEYRVPGWVPPTLRAAWTANGNINNTISDMYIDGRNHASDGTLIPGTGTYAVSSSVPFVNTQSAKIGGTYNQVDFPMTYPENPLVIELYDWGGSFPKSPEEVLGFTPGTLKTLAQSGTNGSQYVTDLKKLTFPLKGITYIEPAVAEITLELLVKNKTPNMGLLIVHNSTTTSRVKELKMQKEYENVPFIGVIITDYSFHHHLNILGAIIQLSPNLETSKTCAGNNNHWVYYSSEAIAAITGPVSEWADQLGNGGGVEWIQGTVAGMGQRRWGVLTWEE
jgi:hypothetical protein